MAETTVKKRNIENFPYKTLFVSDGFSGEENEYVAVPMGLNINGNNGNLSIEVWRSKEAFNKFDYTEKSPKMSKNLPITQDVIKNYADLFTSVEATSLEFLEVDPENFRLKIFEVDLNILQVKFLAQHKTRVNRKSEDSTANAEEFEQLKTSYPQIVELFEKFAFEYMATNEQLSKFK